MYPCACMAPKVPLDLGRGPGQVVGVTKFQVGFSSNLVFYRVQVDVLCKELDL